MSAEIKATIGLTATKGELSLAVATTTKSIDMTGTTYSDVGQIVGTTYEALTIGSDVGTEGWTYFKNLDATNYVEVGVEVAAAFYPLIKLKPGEAALCRLAVGTVFARANTSSVKLRALVLED
jgi:hypothetical protein